MHSLALPYSNCAVIGIKGQNLSWHFNLTVNATKVRISWWYEVKMYVRRQLLTDLLIMLSAKE